MPQKSKYSLHECSGSRCTNCHELLAMMSVDLFATVTEPSDDVATRFA